MLIEDLTPEVDSETATLAWLVEALEHARSNCQTKVVGYLEEVADDVVFEVEMVARRASLVGSANRPTRRDVGRADSQAPVLSLRSWGSITTITLT